MTVRGGLAECGAAALLFGLLLGGGMASVPTAAPAEEASAGEGSAEETPVGDATIDPESPIFLYTHDACRSIYAAAAPDPERACNCMTPLVMQRLTDEARASIAENPDQLPFGATLFRPATPEEEAAQRACME